MLTQKYDACPLCGSTDIVVLREGNCSKHPLWHAELPAVLRWSRCGRCTHVFTEFYWTDEGLTQLFKNTQTCQSPTLAWTGRRLLWSSVVDRVIDLLPSTLHPARTKSLWLDVGPGDGHLLMTAAEFGFATFGMDLRDTTVQMLKQLGYHCVTGDLLLARFSPLLNVISLADVLEHMPFPVKALKKANSSLNMGGVLFVSCPNMDCSEWRAMEAATHNHAYWYEMEHHHNFSRRTLTEILEQCGFEVCRYGINSRYKAGMDLYARKIAELPVDSESPEAPQRG